MRHDGVDKVAFTGSTEVGKAIQRELAGRGVPLTLELGGKAANIVFDDCALDQAVEGIVNGIYFNQGHVCCAGSRLLVQESIYEPLVEKLKRRLQTLRVGDPLDKNTDVGAINSRAQLEKIEELVASGKEEGAEIYQPPCVLPEKGYWFAPTVFTNVAQSYRIAQEEIFGPVLSVLTFRTPDEALEKANNTAVRALRRGVDREGVADPVDGRAAASGCRVGEHLQPLRSGLAVRRLQGVRLRPRGWPARARRVPEVRRGRGIVSAVAAGAVVIRVARPGDGPRLTAIDAVTWVPEVSPAPPPIGSPFFRPGVEPADTIVAVVDGEIAGYVLLGPPTPLPASAHVQMVRGLAVDQSFQRRGVGRALVEAAIAEATARRARKVRLRVLRSNAGAQRLYEECGFVIEGVLRREFVLDGREVDDVLMARMLEP